MIAWENLEVERVGVGQQAPVDLISSPTPQARHRKFREVTRRNY
jgi:hypothetical protein